MGKRRKNEAHVRLYWHELDSAAYRSLSTEARAMLVEARALYAGSENRIHLSIREIRRRLGVGQEKAQRARDELLDRGFLRLLKPASFHCKKRHAPEYALTNEPLDPEKDGATPPKDFMRWEPPKNSRHSRRVQVGIQGGYREQQKPGKNPRHGTQGEYRQTSNPPSHGTQDEYADTATRLFLSAAFCCQGEAQSRLILAGLALQDEKRVAA